MSDEPIKPGYKRTELGVIPENWNLAPLGDVIDVYRGGSPRPIQDYLTTSADGVNWIKIGDVGVGEKYIDSTEEKIKLDGVRYSREVSKGDFLLSNSMSFGRPYISRVDGCIHDGWLVLQNYDATFHREFLYYLLSSKLILDQYSQRASGSSVLNLNKELVASVYLIAPSKAEQAAIAEALSDVDAMLDALDRLIAKKHAIKQVTMQALLTGRVRLPGFARKPGYKRSEVGVIPEDWDIVNVAAHATLKARIGWQGLTTAEYLKEGSYYLVTGTDFVGGKIDWDSCHYVSKSRYDQDKYIQLQPGDVLITKDGTIGKIAYIDHLPRPATLNSGVFVIRSRDQSCSQQYFYYVLESSFFERFLRQLQAGSTINHLYQKDFVNFDFPAPSYSEQTVIAEVLSDMDAEIDALEIRRSKLRDIKQGMLQELLTGRIRLVQPKEKTQETHV